jgi:NAD(P)-dependent dehydrogenase (short-subunit alcohol dehydrogenase family)
LSGAFSFRSGDTACGGGEEVASAVVYPASDEASYVTGAAFTVDGDFTAV